MSRLVGLLLLGIAVGIAATWAYQAGFHRPPPAGSTAAGAEAGRLTPGEAPPKRAIFALGTLEPRDGLVLVTSPLVGTAIRQVPVHEGQLVKQGDVVVELDPTVPQQELEIAQAQRSQAQERQQTEASLAAERLDAAKLALEQARSSREPELQTQHKQVEVAALKAKQADDDLKRLESLAGGASPLASAQQVEHQKTLAQLAKAEREAAAVALKRLEQTLKFNLQKAEAEARAATNALEIAKRGSAVEMLDRQIKLAEHKLAQTKVAAPSSGTVINILAHPGELVSTQPLLQIADLSALQCLAEVDVADLPLLQGQREASISCRAFRGTKVKATIQRIRNVAGGATLRPIDPRKTIDRTVATVVLKVDAKEAAQLLGGTIADAGPALMGLQVDVEIPLEPNTMP